MKLSSLDEYGLRCLLQLARIEPGTSLTIPEISQAEGISTHNVAKLLRLLRRGGVVQSERGQHGGYSLALSCDRILVSEVLLMLGGPLYDPTFCDHFSGIEENCLHSSTECSIRSLWFKVQQAVDQVLSRTTLRDLLHGGEDASLGVANNSADLLGIASAP